jgi:hypothetical protein
MGTKSTFSTGKGSTSDSSKDSTRVSVAAIAAAATTLIFASTLVAT